MDKKTHYTKPYRAHGRWGNDIIDRIVDADGHTVLLLHEGSTLNRNNIVGIIDMLNESDIPLAIMRED